MANDSSTGGYLQGAAPAPIDDQALEDFLATVIVGISGLAANSVIPQLQPEAPDLADFGTNWASFRIANRKADTFAFEGHIDGSGSLPEADQTQRHEELEILLSFYGPNSGAYMSAFRDGIQLAQNREQLMLAVFAHIDTGDEVEVPTLIKDRYTRRKDIPWRVRRQVLRTYPVLDLLSAVGSIVTDVPALSIPLAVNPPN